MTMRTLFVALTASCGGAAAEQGDHAAGHPQSHAGGHDHGHGGHDHGHGEHHHGQGAHHGFSDVERFARIFDDPERDEWQRPSEVVSLLELTSSARVADIGAGTGYFLPHLAPVSEHVLALDVEPGMVAHMEARIDEAGLENVEARIAAPDDPGLDRGSVDRILIVDTWHHIGERERYAARLRDALRPGGFVLVVDFTPDSPHGPPPAMRLDAEAVVRELEAGGLDARIVEESLPYQYAVRATRD